MPLKPQTVFHVTHWKAGSQWVREVLQEAAPDRAIKVTADFAELRPGRFRHGALYTPVYLPAHGLTKMIPDPAPHRCFVVIRDLRDTLVSLYFSVRYSHGAANATVAGTVTSYRERLSCCSEEDGLLIALRERMDPIANIQMSWLRPGELIMRYEDMLADEHAAFRRIFEYCGIEVDPQVRADAVVKHSFEGRTGRKRGDEDVSAHRRKGVSGDWRNHFTPRVTDAFKERFGQTLIETGYEQSTSW